MSFLVGKGNISVISLALSVGYIGSTCGCTFLVFVSTWIDSSVWINRLFGI